MKTCCGANDYDPCEPWCFSVGGSGNPPLRGESASGGSAGGAAGGCLMMVLLLPVVLARQARTALGRHH